MKSGAVAVRAVRPSASAINASVGERAEPKHEERGPTRLTAVGSNSTSAHSREDVARQAGDAALKLVLVVALLRATSQEPRARAHRSKAEAGREGRVRAQRRRDLLE